MQRSLRSLIERMPPPESPPNTQVDWLVVEESLGLPYPESYKEFVSVYGSCHWFDKLVPLYPCLRNPEDMEKFVDYVKSLLRYLDDNTYDNNFRPIELPHYPAPGGLLPFMNDIDGPSYFWLTQGNDPEQWPVYCWDMGPITVLQGMTISDMILGFLERSPPIVELWGDVQKFASHRIRIDKA